MSDGTDAATSQGGAEATAQGAPGTPAQGASEQSAQGAGSGQGDGTASIEALTQKIADLERDNRGYRTREAAREKADRDKATAELSEVEQLRAKVSELETDVAKREAKSRDQSLAMAASATATRLGFRNPALAADILRGRTDVEWNEDGTPKNVDKLLTDWAKANPYAVVVTDFGGGQRGNGSTASGSSDDMNARIRAAAKGRA